MKYSFHPTGVCSREMHLDLSDQDVIEKLEVVGGCSGNLQGIAALVRGMTVEEAIGRLKGIRCGVKPTSCPDQLALGLERMLQERKQG